LAEAVIGFARDDSSLAREAFVALRRLEPSLNADAPALAVLGRLYDLRGDRQKARDLYRKSATLDPSQVEAAVNLGAILFQEGNATEALSWWRKALTAQPGLEAARLNIARLLARRGQVEEARKELRTLLEFSPGHPTAIEQLDMLK
jgi:tetratricopeptide (TPR) repeat protein